MASLLGSAIKVAQLLGTVGTVATLGEAVGKRVGLLDKSTNILIEGTNFALDLFGAPKDSAIRPGRSEPQLPPVGDAASEARVICADCQAESDLPLIAGVAGEQIHFAQCKRHYDGHIALQGTVGAMYGGWAASFGLGESICGGKPVLSSGRYTKYKKVGSKQYPYQDPVAYYRDLSDWQSCAAKEKDANSVAQKQIDDAAKKTKDTALRSAFALSAQKKSYESQIASLQAQQAAEKDAQKQTEIQAKIDAATARAEAAEKLAADMKQGAKDEAMAAKIQSLQDTIAAQANKPGGMDQFLQQLVLQQMANQQSQMAAPASDPMAMLAPAMVEMPVPVADAGTVQYDTDDPYALYGSGDDSAALDPEMADLLGFHGARTLGEARALFDLRQGGFTNEELEAALADNQEPLGSSCSLGSCSPFQQA